MLSHTRLQDVHTLNIRSYIRACMYYHSVAVVIQGTCRMHLHIISIVNEFYINVAYYDLSTRQLMAHVISSRQNGYTIAARLPAFTLVCWTVV